ncbi:MAG: extracellular solute-binding protein [bacterium]|nr:extracellular solute-binding protein [bacterium]
MPTYTGHAIAMHGDVKYGPDFKHFEYVNPNAPKGGRVKMAALGTFDSLNGNILKGVTAYGLGLIGESLMQSSRDEAFTEYCLLAESIEVPDDRSWATFTLRAEARWHDDKPVTVDDVIFSLETLKTKGHPYFKSYYGDVQKAEKVGERQVKFTFAGEDNRELPLIVGQLPILPKHYWETHNFEKTTLEPPLGSGPYKIESVEAGRSITYRRVENYWGKNLAINKGHYNPDVIRYDYYKDANVAIEALKSAEYDFRSENISKEWATAYNIPALEDGRLVKELISHENGTGMQGFWFNMRRAKFADPKVRHALAYAFDFEWTNAKLFYGQYERTTSYFSNTELASSDFPEGKELAILETYRGRIPDEVFTKTYVPPSTDGSGNLRQNLRTGRTMLREAGWEIKEGKLTHNQTGEVMTFEFLLISPSFERVVGPMVQNLKRLGIEATIRIVDTAQYQNRLQEFDFDIIVSSRGQSLSPGNEQRNYWTTKSADTSGSRNYAGIKNPVIDEMVETLINAPDRETLVAATRALDRVLLWGHYVIPHWHIRSHRLVYWNKFGKPSVTAKYMSSPFSTFPSTWWVDQAKAAKLTQGE